jgi:hypothetical protein
MHKKYIVRLTEAERQTLEEVIKKLKGTSQKVRRAHILLKADADGPAWTDARIAEAFDCRVQTIENLRKRLVTESFELALNGKKRQTPPTEPLLDGRGEAQLIAMRLGKPPAGYGKWTLRLLADELVALEIVESISYETVRRTLKKRHDQADDRVLGHPATSERRVCRSHGRSARNIRKSLRSCTSGSLYG